MFADAENEDAIIAYRGQTRLPAFLAPALFGLQVEVVEGRQRAEGAKDLTSDVQNGLAVGLSGSNHLERIIIEAKNRVILRLGAADVTRKVVSTVDRAEPFLPLRELRVEHWPEG